MFDTFVGGCPCCGKEVQSQSKDFGCTLRCFRPGDTVMTTTLRMRDDDCYNDGCNTKLAIAIEDGIFLGFEKHDPSISKSQAAELSRKELKMLLNNALYYMRCDCGDKCSCGRESLRSRIEEKALGRPPK